MPEPHFSVFVIASPKFHLGRLVATANALSILSGNDINTALTRHANGDWGDLDAEDAKANDHALEHGGRLFSAYHSTENIKFWIITESDRSATTVLLLEDY